MLSTISSIECHHDDDIVENTSSFASSHSQKRKRLSKNKFDTLIDTMTAISNKKIDTFVKGIEDDVDTELRHFFSSLSRTVSKFDEFNQALAKKRIMDVVIEMEFARLKQPQQNLNHTFPTQSKNLQPQTIMNNSTYATEEQSNRVFYNL